MATVEITFTENGPTEIVGDVLLKDHQGRVIKSTPGEPIYLCRCGQSSTKPFCDGTHAAIGFDGTLAT